VVYVIHKTYDGKQKGGADKPAITKSFNNKPHQERQHKHNASSPYCGNTMGTSLIRTINDLKTFSEFEINKHPSSENYKNHYVL
jgi:hypothetical protein